MLNMKNSCKKKIDKTINPLLSEDGWTIKHITSSANASEYWHHLYAFFVLERKVNKKLNE